MTTDDIIDVEERLAATMRGSHVAELEGLLSPRLTFVGLEGSLVDKTADLAAHRNGVIRIDRLEFVERGVQLYGGFAVVNAVAEMRGRYGGQPFSGRFRYKRVWHLDDGRWQVVAGQVCAVKPAL